MSDRVGVELMAGKGLLPILTLPFTGSVTLNQLFTL